MVYGYSVKKADGAEISMQDFQGKVLLIVNVASECGFTGQYDGLEKLHEKYAEKGLQIIGFPCNQFGGQEPGTDEQIQQFCRTSFGVQFPVMAKIDVNGANAHPLYQYLKKEAKGILGTEAIKWNFTKFLVDRNGKVIDRFAPNDKPESLVQEIEKLL
jgi:glutathione peroxidase